MSELPIPTDAFPNTYSPEEEMYASHNMRNIMAPPELRKKKYLGPGVLSGLHSYPAGFDISGMLKPLPTADALAHDAGFENPESPAPINVVRALWRGL